MTADVVTFQQRLRDAVNAMEQATGAAELWQDDMRQRVEQRLGVEAGDMAVLDDPGYDRVMVLRSRLLSLFEDIRRIEEEVRTSDMEAPSR